MEKDYQLVLPRTEKRLRLVFENENEVYEAYWGMKVADKTSNMSLNRLEQIKAFAIEANYKTIGIAHCITFSREAAIIKKHPRIAPLVEKTIPLALGDSYKTFRIVGILH